MEVTDAQQADNNVCINLLILAETRCRKPHIEPCRYVPKLYVGHVACNQICGVFFNLQIDASNDRVGKTLR